MEGVAMNNATGINKIDFLVENLVKKSIVRAKSIKMKL